MAISWKEDGDGRAHLGMSMIEQVATASFGSADYPTGGYAVLPSVCGLSRIRGIWEIGVSGTVVGVVWKWNKTTSKLQAFWGSATASTALTEVTANTDLSAMQVQFMFNGF
jgi:hypothetical protein